MMIFYDSEFTGLHQYTTLISMGLVDKNGRSFYAEFSDYAQEQCDEWINEHVLKHTRWLSSPTTQQEFCRQEGDVLVCYGNKAFVRQALETWLQDYQNTEICADCLAYDWVLFCELFGGALNIPKQVFYMPFDLPALFEVRGLSPDTNRESFADFQSTSNLDQRHNALYDANLTKACYNKLMHSINHASSNVSLI